jgi:hypothetical protein
MCFCYEYTGNIRVFCRCRPLNKVEMSAGCTTVVDFDAAKDALGFWQLAPLKNLSDLTGFIHQKMIKVCVECDTRTLFA